MLSAIIINVWVVLQTKSQVYSDLQDVPNSDIALVLGTSKYLVEGGINPYFKNRIEAASELYKANKIKHIIVSGDHRTEYYNEPKTMMEELVLMGIPEEAITLDHAGLRTLDSIVRCKEVFGEDNIIVVTQKFHTYRALFISQYYSLKASGYVAGNIPLTNSLSILVREFFARPLAVLDLYILNTKPELGRKQDQILK